MISPTQTGDYDLKKPLLLSTALMLAVILVPGSFLVAAGPTAQQATATTTASTPTIGYLANCSTYQTNLLVDWVNSTPHSVAVGDLIITTFHVVYPDGTPVLLSPRTASFNWTGPSGWKYFSNVQVIFNGTPGFYYYYQNFTQDIIQATGPGTITIAVASCSCSDSLGNRGPTGDTSSIQTITPHDLSQLVPLILTTTSTTQVTPPPQFPAALALAIIIILLLILALLMFVLRRRRKKT